MNEALVTKRAVISTDGATSGRRAACAAVVAINGQVLVRDSQAVGGLEGYTLAAEIAGVALAARLAEQVLGEGEAVTVEVDNPYVPRVIDGSYRPPGFRHIPVKALDAARTFCVGRAVTFRVLPRNSTSGLRLADRMAGQRLWGHRRRRRNPRQMS